MNGTVVADRFEIERLAGEGGMCTVFRALDRASGHPVAIKLLRERDPDLAERFAREARLLAELDHPAIVRHIEHGVTRAGDLYLVMEWLEGEDLARRVARGPLAPEEGVLAIRRAADALAGAHARGMVHRDLKPSNLFLPGGRIADLKVLDFGVARITGGTVAATRTGMVLGTPAYMAPEQARGERQVDARADVFSLGCVLFECLTGVSAFVAEHPLAVLARILLEEAPRVRELRPEVSPALDDLVARMLSKDARERPAHAAAVIGELDALDTAVAGVARREGPARAITTGERRVLTVMLVGSAQAGGNGAALDEAVAAARAPGARWERLADGSQLFVLAGTGTATDQAREAARAALALRALLPDAPIAIATGRGHVTERLPVGEAIDRAVAMQRATAAGDRGIRLDHVSAGLLDASFDVDGDDAGLFLRGERERVEESRRLLGKPTPFVGRSRELGVLQGFFDECLEEPRARAVLVTAPPGMGKSRLGYEFTRLARQREPRLAVWTARGDPMSMGSSFGMLAPMLRREARVLDGEPLAVRQHKLRARIARHQTSMHLGRLTDFVGELAGVPFPDAHSAALRAARLDPRLMGDQMLHAWEEMLAGECAAQPLLLVLEDLHWGDLPSVRFVDSALRHLSEAPFMVLALARPEVNDLFPKLWGERHVQEIRLEELSAKASASLARNVLGGDIDAAVIDRIAVQSAGNAFYLEELIRAVAEGRTGEMPETVLAMVQARLDALEPEARRALRAASVFGASFWPGGVAALLGGDAASARVGDQLARLAEAEWLASHSASRFPAEREFTFRHALVREAAYAAFTEDDRTLGHRLAGEWLERAGESDALALAEHFDRGALPARAQKWFVEAASQALAGNDFAGALARAERAETCGVEGPDLGRLRLIQTQSHMWRLEHDREETRAFESLRLLPRGSDLWYRVLGAAVQAATSLGHKDRLLEGVDLLAETLTQGAPHAEQVGACARATSCLVNFGLYERADVLLAWIMGPAKALLESDPYVGGTVFLARAGRALSTGDISGFLEHTLSGGAIFRQLGSLRNQCVARENVGYGYRELGMYGDSEAALREALALATRVGVPMTQTVVKHNLGPTLAHLGKIEEALVFEREALGVAKARSNQRLEGGSRIYLAEILMMAGDPAAAEEEAREATRVLAAAPPLLAYARAVLALVLLERDRRAEALDEARAAMKGFEDLGGIEEGESSIRLALAQALQATGDAAEAERVIAAARERLMARAALVTDTTQRASFLAIAENARTLELAREWLGA